LGDPHTVTVRAADPREPQHKRQPDTWTRRQFQRHPAIAERIPLLHYDHTWSLTAGRFSIDGTAAAALYGTFTGSPNSAGRTTEIAYLPFSYGRPSFWPWLNMCIGLQYVLYIKFDGATTNINGAGRNAHNNDTIFAYA
jgi:hypothetical protein